MEKRHIIEDIHRMRFEEINGSYQKGRLSCEEAAEILWISVRTKEDRYPFEGIRALLSESYRGPLESLRNSQIPVPYNFWTSNLGGKRGIPFADALMAKINQCCFLRVKVR